MKATSSSHNRCNQSLSLHKCNFIGVAIQACQIHHLKKRGHPSRLCGVTRQVRDIARFETAYSVGLNSLQSSHTIVFLLASFICTLPASVRFSLPTHFRPLSHGCMALQMAPRAFAGP